MKYLVPWTGEHGRPAGRRVGFNLQEKLGPILWQFPPTLKYDRERLESFLALFPHDTRAASRLARGHAAWMKKRIQLAAGPVRTLRHAIEIRHESFLEPSFIKLLRAYRVGLVVAETAGRWPLVHDVTTATRRSSDGLAVSALGCR